MEKTGSEEKDEENNILKSMMWPYYHCERRCLETQQKPNKLWLHHRKCTQLDVKSQAISCSLAPSFKSHYQ
ncbi:hypothetical protein LINGRAHAP2_LOCUS30394, partial [Linum grandiflorum]